LPQAEEVFDRWEKTKSCQVPKSIRSPPMEHKAHPNKSWAQFQPAGREKKHPQSRIAMRPKLARSCWFDTMMGNSLRKIGRDRQGKQCKEVCFWLVLSMGFPQQEHPAGCQIFTVIH
jgi:hypothetical protein